MLTSDLKQLKVIDFGFTFKYQVGETTSTQELVGTVTSQERTYDLKCVINIIMYMHDANVRSRVNEIQTLPSAQGKLIQSLNFWKETERINENYSNLLKLTNNLNKSSDFDVLKDQL
ncbi:hypothetical protein I4U23_026118 [Adineta vaga]|nr:hypothetical protein I4U23_026118 [Adineta vaga]